MSKQSDEPGGSQVDDLYSRLARDAARLLVVHEAGQILRSTTDPKELAGGLLANIAEAVFSGSGCVARVQDEECEILASVGLDEEKLTELEAADIEQKIFLEVAARGEPMAREEILAEIDLSSVDEETDWSSWDEEADDADEGSGDGETGDDGGDAEADDAGWDAEAGVDDWDPEAGDNEGDAEADGDDWGAAADGDVDAHEPEGQPMFDLYVPLTVEERVIGVMALGARVDAEQHSEADQAFAMSLGSQLALALANADLFVDKEKRIEQLSVILRISKEITSTLDLDRVLTTVAQMLSLIVPNRRALLALSVGESVEIRASSQDGFDVKAARKDPLLPAIRWVQGAHQPVNVSHTELTDDPDIPGRNVLLEILQPDEGPDGLAILPLQDDEGVLGFMAIESDEDAPPLDEEAEELVEILANQTTVAIRNAELYRRLPMIGGIMAKQRHATGWRRWARPVTIVALLAGGFLIEVPAWVSGDALVRPRALISVRAATEGTVEEILVREGDDVEAGTIVARMRRDDLEVGVEQARATILRTRAEAGGARQLGDLAGYQARQADLSLLDEELRFLASEIERTDLVAPVAGVVLTPRVELRRGVRLARGSTLLELADLRDMEVEVLVPQEELNRVAPGANVRIRVHAYPGRTFAGNVVSISPRADEELSFRLTIGVDNSDGALRPGMTGRAHIDTEGMPVLTRPLRSLGRWLRIKFWV